MSAASSGKISLALGGAKKPAPTNGVKRSHAALQDHEEDDQDRGKAQTVSHFDKTAGGAIDENKAIKDQGPLVIAPQANRDWKEASQKNKRQRHGKAAGEEGAVNGEALALKELEEKKPVYGLNVRKRTPDEDSPDDATLEEAPPDADGDASVKAKTEDEEAMDALLGKNTKSDLVLPAMSEEEAFDRDYKEAPDMATLDDYARVPVEQFGAALLRGMGWKDGEGIGSDRGKKMHKTKIPEKRPALLGIGAKEEAAVAQEMGTWGKAAKDKKGPQQIYNPTLLRDKKTGELFTEEELEKKKAQVEREKYEAEFERKEGRKEKERRDKGKDDSRERDYERRDRRERRDSRDRRRHDDSDDEYYRKKEKRRRERERERERDDDRYDRERSRRHESDRERRHESDRDKHRDRHRDRRR